MPGEDKQIYDVEFDGNSLIILGFEFSEMMYENYQLIESPLTEYVLQPFFF